MATEQTYVLDGPTEFFFPFPVRTSGEIIVSLIPGGVLPSSEYTVIGTSATANGVTVRYPNAPRDGQSELNIARRTEANRVSTFLDDLSITATGLNAEFDNILQIVQDGVLNEYRGEWDTGELYFVLDVVTGPDGNIYISRQQHQADDFSTDLSEGKWDLYADFNTGQQAIDAALDDAEAARDKAEQWAEEPEDSEVESGSFSALHYSAKAEASAQIAAPVVNITSEIQTVAGIESEIQTVVGIEGDIQTVAGIASDVTNVSSISNEVQDVSESTNEIDIVASDLAGAGFDYDLGTITQPTEGVIGTPDGYIISVFNIRDEIVTVDGISSDVTTVAGISSDVTNLAAVSADVTTAADNIVAIQNAPQAASDAEAAELAAQNSAQAAASSESNAQTSENNALTSEQNASTSESNALTSEQNAATSESNALTSEQNASQSASDASVSESNAETFANEAETARDEVTELYLGAKASDPTTDNEGDPLQVGALYYNTNQEQILIYDGAVWQVAAFSADAAVVTFNGRSGAVSLQSADVTGALGYTPQDEDTAYDSADFAIDFGAETTDGLDEGTTNLYYTDARVSSLVNKAFVDALNVNADTLDGEQGTYYLDRANHTGTQTLASISDAGALASLNEVDTAQIANQAVTDDKLAQTLDLGSI